jgi:putative transcriptional regulator
MKKNFEESVQLHNRVGEIRNQIGFPQMALADRVGIHRSHLHRIELGEVVPSVVVALQIARYLNVAIEDIFSIKETTPLSPQEKLQFKIATILRKIRAEVTY